MFFNKKNSDKCKQCNKNVESSFNFCPHCGISNVDQEKQARDYGMLGKKDAEEKVAQDMFSQNLGITDKIMGSLVNGLMKSLDRQFKEMGKTEFKNMPQIKIKLSPINNAQKEKRTQRKTVTDEQLNRMASMPRADAKTQVRRLSDKVIYELNTPGIESVHDIFISKSESGFEVKAIGKNKVYVKNLQVALPLKSYSIAENKVLVEFALQEDLPNNFE